MWLLADICICITPRGNCSPDICSLYARDKRILPDINTCISQEVGVFCPDVCSCIALEVDIFAGICIGITLEVFVFCLIFALLYR